MCLPSHASETPQVGSSRRLWLLCCVNSEVSPCPVGGRWVGRMETCENLPWAPLPWAWPSFHAFIKRETVVPWASLAVGLALSSSACLGSDNPSYLSELPTIKRNGRCGKTPRSVLRMALRGISPGILTRQSSRT